MRASRPQLLALAAVLCVFCVPLFVGLGQWDLRSDETIYSYAVDRILETGDWLTPRIIPTDGPFLEKPPLKFWIVAGAMRAGVLPRGEFGLRFFDALFGAAGFVYVFLLGRRLAGPMCGVIAVLILFTQYQLLFVHGVRSNNMESPLFLCYCGGMYHFARWQDAAVRRVRSTNALVVALYFTLGFMTKFVAALFLPLVCALALAWRKEAYRRFQSEWREWVVPALVAVALIAPWFVYQARHAGPLLWQTMFGAHVYERFTASLDPTHLRPWHYYYSTTWAALTETGSHWIVLLGGALLAVNAWSGRSRLTRLVLLWWMVPFALISLGTSKLFHYAYPFLPPLALAAGAAAVAMYQSIEPRIAAGALRQIRIPTSVRYLFLAISALAATVAVMALVAGDLRWKAHGIQLLRNSSVSRPLIVAIIFVWLAGYAAALSRVVAGALIAVWLPLWTYHVQLSALTTPSAPLRTLRDCMRQMAQPNSLPSVYAAYEELQDHSYYYYLSDGGRWIEHPRPATEELPRVVLTGAGETPSLLLREDYEKLPQHIRSHLPGFFIWDHVVILTPGTSAHCGRAAVAAGGRDLVALPIGGSGR